MLISPRGFIKNVYMEKCYCPKCNTEFELGTRFCQRCGCNLELEFIQNPVCPKCHKTYPAETKFCNIDGAKLTSPDKLIPKCVKCGLAYPADTKFCPVDGGAVIAEAYRYGQANTVLPNSGTYPKASLGNRFLASLLDGLITIGLAIPAIIFYAIGMAQLDSHRRSDDAFVWFIFAVFLYFIPLIYSFIKDGLGQGQSWGKKAVGLMVVYLPKNTPCTKGESAIRCLIGSLLGIIPFVGWLIEPIMVLANEDGRRLADKVANTQVIEINMFNK
jgi:uncharacterized RDD family membrane protein YckC